ncbi:MAG: ChrB protein [Chloroflexi bacterium]|nr:ChrB protein [Chloroflexota bacterium]
MNTWLLLHYKIPAHPSALRVYAWRKLKRLGAILLNDVVWVLPDTPRTAEQFQWLAAEIRELGGEAHLWRSSPVLGVQEESLVEQFNGQAEWAYASLLKKLDGKKPNLAALSREYQQIASGDYFHSALGQQVRGKLLALRGGKG